MGTRDSVLLQGVLFPGDGAWLHSQGTDEQTALPMFPQPLPQAALPAPSCCPSETVSIPKAFQAGWDQPNSASSLETAPESELPFPLIHPIVFLHFLPHKTPQVHPFGSTCRAHFGREINSRVLLWIVTCPVNKAVSSSEHISRLVLVALGLCWLWVWLGQKLHFAIC